ncbi:MAG: PolC-type DNA polymerase III [Lachnospiraceae bacterium]|nr:PolC-type DNA polymerase III [Lachnospiraceae bacterium]
MSKPFFEALPDFRAPEGMQQQLERSSLLRAVPKPDGNRIVLYLSCPFLMEKRDVYRLEAALTKQYFAARGIKVQIIERFALSGQYTPENLTEMYLPSMLLETKEISMRLYHVLRHSQLSFSEEGVVVCDVPRDALLRSQGDSLKAYLEKVYTERCGLAAEVRMVYDREAGLMHREEIEERLRAEARSISRAAQESGAEGAGAETAAGQEMPWDTGDGAPQGAGESAPAADAFRASEGAPAAAEGAAPFPAGTGSAAKPAGEEKAKKGAGRSGGGRGARRDGRGGLTRGRGMRRKSEDPDIFWGDGLDEEITPMSELNEASGSVTVSGEIFFVEERKLRSGSSMFLFNVTDGSDSISVKVFAKEDEGDPLRDNLKNGAWVTVRGLAGIDAYDGELSLTGVRAIKKIPARREVRQDFSTEKRVELHCHTKMSEMDAVADVEALLKRAHDWGHPAMAITDHGVVQSFPLALKYQRKWEKDDPFKIIYGLEGYLVDDLKQSAVRPEGKDFTGDFVVFDIETTGLSAQKDRIIEIGAVRVSGGEIAGRFSTFVNPRVPIPYRIQELTRIQDSMVENAPPVEEVLPKFLAFCEGASVVAHNADFDSRFIAVNAERLGLTFAPTIVDTMVMGRLLFPTLRRHTLDAVAKALTVPLEGHHRAVNDAECTAQVFLKMVSLCEKRGIRTLEELNEAGKSSPEAIRRMKSYHVILLAANETGRVNLYRLVSESHLNYMYNRRPRIPKSLLMECREGLIVGSACAAGELVQALLDGATDSEIAKIVRFYDYLEIQPIGNNRFLLHEGKHGDITTEEDLRDINRTIVALGEKFDKPVAATGDVHFLDPEDAVYRSILVHGTRGKAGKEDEGDSEPDSLYLHTTDEMLEEFSYLGPEKAREVVITTPNRIADRIERISPVRPDKCPPVIEDSDKTLREICYKKAHEMYGDPLPEIVQNRLEKELTSIIGNGYAVMYIIAQKLVWKSNEDGYVVGSRGSVGSSFVATMAGITEVNPLPPHYVCPHCKYSDFTSEEVRAYAGEAGWDLPDRVCPVCGKPLAKDGFDIPFETFLGFYGNKEPDIDLNFSGEYQPRAHAYTEEIFGKGHTFRAGTIGTLADKTAYGFVSKYLEEVVKEPRRKCEKERLAMGLTGVRRTTGQHPGGIVVLPHGEDINSFTPVQHPAKDSDAAEGEDTKEIITTHFEYHSIEHNLLKLDILGHDDPTMIRRLRDITGIDPQKVPLDEPEIVQLFQSTAPLGIRPEDIGGTKFGTLGIPEFGTDFAMGILEGAKPQSISDLVRISGLSHGTNVWQENAEILLAEGTATLREAICCRDDIMIYLISMGLEAGEAFNIMEAVRKNKFNEKDNGKKLGPWIQHMQEAGVPEWYIESCRRIRYMFPKAHAAAYVTMAGRIAWFKIHQPLAYYAAYFSIRSKAFDYGLMCQGRSALEHHIEAYRKADKLEEKAKDELRDMRSVQEMYARGYEFTPIDIYRAHPTHFLIVDGKIMPALTTISGLGEKAAEMLAAEAKKGPFLSREDLCQRARVASTVADHMADLGLLGGLPATNQMSLFDLSI